MSEDNNKEDKQNVTSFRRMAALIPITSYRILSSMQAKGLADDKGHVDIVTLIMALQAPVKIWVRLLVPISIIQSIIIAYLLFR